MAGEERRLAASAVRVIAEPRSRHAIGRVALAADDMQ